MTHTRLDVTGIGVAHGLGDLPALAKVAASDFDALLQDVPAVDVTPLGALLPGVSLRRVPRYARLALLATLRARSPEAAAIAPEQQALVVATAHAGAAMSCDFMDSILDWGPQLSSPMAFSHAVNNMGAGLLSLLLGIRGPCCTVMNGALSLCAALDAASLLLHSDRARVVWVCVVDENEPRLAPLAPELPYGIEGAVCLELRLPGKAKCGPYVETPRWGRSQVPGSPKLPLESALRVALSLHTASTPVTHHMDTVGTRVTCTVTLGNHDAPAA